MISQADAIETQRNIRAVKKLYGHDNLKKKNDLSNTGASKNDQIEQVGGVAGMTTTIEPARVTSILKDNKDLI
jgi:hypothetical protein